MSDRQIRASVVMSDAARLAGEAAMSRASGDAISPATPEPADAREGEEREGPCDDEDSVAEGSPRLPPELPDEVIERILRHALGDHADRWSLGERFRTPPARGQPRPFRQPRGPLRLVGKRWRDMVDVMCKHIVVDKAVMVGDEALNGVLNIGAHEIETLTLVGSHTEGGELKLGMAGLGFMFTDRGALFLKALTIRDTGMKLDDIFQCVQEMLHNERDEDDVSGSLRSLTIDGDSRQSRDRTPPFETSMCFPIENGPEDIEELTLLLELSKDGEGLEELHLMNLSWLMFYPLTAAGVHSDHLPRRRHRYTLEHRHFDHCGFADALQASSLKSLTLDRVGLHDRAAERIVAALPPTIEAFKMTCHAIPEEGEEPAFLRNGEPDLYRDNIFNPKQGFQRTWPRLLCERLAKGELPVLNDVTLPGEYIGATTALLLDETLRKCAGASPPREFMVTFTTFDAEGIPTIPEAILGRWRLHKSKYADASLESKELGSVTVSSTAPDIPEDGEEDGEPHPTSWSETRLAVELAHHMAQREAFVDTPHRSKDDKYDSPEFMQKRNHVGPRVQFPETSVPKSQYIEWTAMRMWTALGYGAPRAAYAAARDWLLARPKDDSLRKLAARAYLKDWVLAGALGLVTQIKPDHCMPCGLWETATALRPDADLDDKITKRPQFPILHELICTVHGLARKLEKRAAVNVPNSDFVPDGITVTQAGLRKCSLDPDLGRALTWRGYFWPGQDEHAFHRAVMCVLLKHWITMVFEDEELHPGHIADHVIEEVEEALFTQLIAFDVVSDAINECFACFGMFNGKDEGSGANCDQQGMPLFKREWTREGRRLARSCNADEEDIYTLPFKLLWEYLHIYTGQDGCAWAMYDAIYRSLDYQRMRFEGPNTTLNYASFDRWTVILLNVENAPAWIRSARGRPWPDVEAALRIAARVIAGVKNENDFRRPEIEAIADILTGAAELYPKHPWRIDAFSHEGSTASSSSEAIRELDAAVEAFFKRRKFAPLPLIRSDPSPLIRSWAEWLHAIGSPPPLTIDEARAKSDELTAGNSEYERLEAELASVQARMEKLGNKLRGVHSDIKTSTAFHKAPTMPLLDHAAESWRRARHRTTVLARRDAKLNPAQPWRLDASRRDSFNASSSYRELRRHPSPLTDIPDERRQLQEMDDVTRGAMVKLFEHCDAAASYVEVDSRSDGETAGWSRVDDAHGLNLQTLTTPHAAVLAAYVHEREENEEQERGEGVGSARRSLGNVLRVLGVSGDGVYGLLGLMDRARAANDAKAAGGTVDFSVDDRLAASIPCLYTGDDIGKVDFRDIYGEWVRRGGEDENTGSDDVGETRT